MIGYSLIQFWYWFVHGNVANFASVYLLDKGISNSFIGILIALSCCGSILIQTFASAWADRVGIKALKILQIFSDLTLIACSFACIIFSKSASAIPVFFYAVMLIITQMLLPFVNALGTESIRRGMNINYGFARGMGSVGYAFMSFLIGRISGSFGPGAIPFSIIVSTLIYLFCFLFFLPGLNKADKDYKARKEKAGAPDNSDNADNPHSVQAKKKPAPGGPAFIRKYHYFGYLLGGYVLVYMCHVFMNTFLYQIVLSKGGTSVELGSAMAISAISELPVMFFFDHMLKRKNSAFWLRLSGTFFTVKAIGLFFAPNIPLLYVVQVFQMLGWGLISVASVRYIDKVMHPEDKIKGQAYMSASFTFAKIIATMTGGILIDNFGVRGMLLFAIAVSSIGAIIQAVIITLHPDLNAYKAR